MKYRIAIFRRAMNKLVFNKFAYDGFRIAPDGQLWKGSKVCNTTDRRGRMYYEIHRQLPKCDRLGNVLYEHDIIFDSRFNALAIIGWSDSYCAFVLTNKNRGLKLTYRYCDFRDSVEKIGNEYENVLQQVSAKGFTK